MVVGATRAKNMSATFQKKNEAKKRKKNFQRVNTRLHLIYQSNLALVLRCARCIIVGCGGLVAKSFVGFW